MKLILQSFKYTKYLTNSDATDVPSDFEDLGEPIKLLEPPREEKNLEKIDVPIKPISQGTLSYTEIYQARLILYYEYLSKLKIILVFYSKPVTEN